MVFSCFLFAWESLFVCGWDVGSEHHVYSFDAQGFGPCLSFQLFSLQSFMLVWQKCVFLQALQRRLVISICFILQLFHGLRPLWVCLLMANSFCSIFHDLPHSTCWFSISLPLLNGTSFPAALFQSVSFYCLLFSLCLLLPPNPDIPVNFPWTKAAWEHLKCLWQQHLCLAGGGQRVGSSSGCLGATVASPLPASGPWPSKVPAWLLCVPRQRILAKKKSACRLSFVLFGDRVAEKDPKESSAVIIYPVPC